MNNKAIVKQGTKEVAAVFEQMKGQFKAALPKHITPDRMVRVALTAIQNTPKLLECDKNSLYLSVLRAAQLGLEPDGVLGQAYLLPYAGKVQLIVGYKGLIDLARRSGEVSNIIAKEVCENDDFDIIWHEEVPFRHKQSITGERGDIIGFWAMARFKDGGFHFDYMSRHEVETIRDGSSGWQTAKRYNKTADSPWSKHFAEMGKKTVIRRIAKFLPMSVQRAAVVEDMVDAGKQFSVDGGDVIIEHEASVVDDINAHLREETEAAYDSETGEIIEHKPEATEEQVLPSLEEVVAMPRDNIGQREKLAKAIIKGVEAKTFTKIEASQAQQENGYALDELIKQLGLDGRGTVSNALKAL